MVKKFIVFHLLPFSIALFLAIAVVLLFQLEQQAQEKTVEGRQGKTNGWYANLSEGDQAEIDYLASIKSDEQLTVFGSSEFSNSPYCPYHFLTDSFGIQTLGIGHAYHQNFSILIELLAADQFLNGANITVVLSLSWFETDGTNPSAFIEFAKPNFLKTIMHNTEVPIIYKSYIGKYIYQHEGEILGITNDMLAFRDIYLKNEGNFLQKGKANLREYLNRFAPIFEVNFIPEPVNRNMVKRYVDYTLLASELQSQFESEVTNNNLYVQNDYYEKYLLDKNGNERIGSIDKIDLLDNEEWEDFKLLVAYLKAKKSKVSFIIQPSNPYYYPNLDRYNELIDSITYRLDQNQIPYLNMHVNTKEDYEPGVLKDVMHLGSYGWMKINMFLEKQYHEEQNN